MKWMNTPFEKGILTIKEILNENGRYLKFHEFQSKYQYMKYYIYSSKLNEKALNLSEFVSKVLFKYKLERI